MFQLLTYHSRRLTAIYTTHDALSLLSLSEAALQAFPTGAGLLWHSRLARLTQGKVSVFRGHLDFHNKPWAPGCCFQKGGWRTRYCFRSPPLHCVLNTLHRHSGKTPGPPQEAPARSESLRSLWPQLSYSKGLMSTLPMCYGLCLGVPPKSHAVTGAGF